MGLGIRADGHFQYVMRKNIVVASFSLEGPILRFDLVGCKKCGTVGLNLQDTDYVCTLPEEPESIEDAFDMLAEALIIYKEALEDTEES